jgi:hypothetical protein
MISKFDIDFNNESVVFSATIQTENKEQFREELHEKLDNWLDNLSDDSHFYTRHKLENNFQLSK